MREIRDIVNDVAREHYERVTYVPPELRNGLRIAHNPAWEALPEYDREHYRRVVEPIVTDTVAFARL